MSIIRNKTLSQEMQELSQEMEQSSETTTALIFIDDLCTKALEDSTKSPYTDSECAAYQIYIINKAKELNIPIFLTEFGYSEIGYKPLKEKMDEDNFNKYFVNIFDPNHTLYVKYVTESDITKNPAFMDAISNYSNFIIMGQNREACLRDAAFSIFTKLSRTKKVRILTSPKIARLASHRKNKTTAENDEEFLIASEGVENIGMWPFETEIFINL